MWRFSHWEVESIPGFWRDRYVRQPVYVWVPEIVVRLEVTHVVRDETRDQIEQYERETALAIVLKRKVDAQSALVESVARLAINKAQLRHVLSLTKRADFAELDEMPVVDADEIRR